MQNFRAKLLDKSLVRTIIDDLWFVKILSKLYKRFSDSEIKQYTAVNAH